MCNCSVLEILCTDPGSIEFGSKQPGLRDFDRDYLTVGDKVGYYCFPGYKMEGTSPLVCTDRGEWNNPKPTCVCKFIVNLLFSLVA